MKAAQLVETVLAEGKAKAFLRSVAPTAFSWLRPFGFQKVSPSAGRIEFAKVVSEHAGARYIVRVIISDEHSPAAQVAGALNAAPAMLGSGVIEVSTQLWQRGEETFSFSRDYYAHPERVPFHQLQKMLSFLLKRLCSVPPQALHVPSTISSIRRAFEDTDLGYHQAMADAAHAHDEDEPDDEP